MMDEFKNRCIRMSVAVAVSVTVISVPPPTSLQEHRFYGVLSRLQSARSEDERHGEGSGASPTD